MTEVITDFANSLKCVYQCFPVLATINWLEELSLVVSAVLIAVAIVLPIIYISEKYLGWFMLHSRWSTLYDYMDAFLSGRKLKPPRYPLTPNRQCVCGPSCAFDSTVRTVFGFNSISIYAWPSKGGLIVLENAMAMDFEFLGLDPLDPPRNRYGFDEQGQAREDEFCKRLLLLGVFWWDSEARYKFISLLREGDDSALLAIEMENEPEPTEKEKRVTFVGWNSGEKGGCWAVQFTDTRFYDYEAEDSMPDDIERLSLCRSMDERCEMLGRRFGAVWYKDVGDVVDIGCLNAWGTKEGGEVGELERRKWIPKKWRERVREKLDV